MQVIALGIANIGGISAIELDLNPEGILEIKGPNGAGKSSILNALIIALSGGKIPPDTIKKGEDEADIYVKLQGKNKQYEIERVLSGGSTKKLKVWEALGNTRIPVSSPQQWLNDLGCNFLDPSLVQSMSADERIKKLFQVIGLDELEKHEKEIENNRSAIGATRKAIGNLSEEFPEKPILIDIGRFQAEKDLVTTRIQKRFRLEEDKERLKNEVERLQKKIAEIIKNISDLPTRSEYKFPEQILEETKKDIYDLPENAEALNAAFLLILENNKRYAEYERFLKDKKRKEKLDREWDEENKKLKKVKQEKIEKIEKTLPSPFEIKEKKILYNGIEIDSLSSSEQILCFLRMASIFSGEIKTILIKDGSLLDEDSRKKVFEFVTENNFQIILEIVTAKKGDSTLEIVGGKIKSEQIGKPVNDYDYLFDDDRF